MYERRAGSLDALVLNALHVLSDEQITEATGRKRAYFYRVTNPMETQQLRLDHAAALDAALIAAGKPPIFLEALQALTAETAQRLSGKAPAPAIGISAGLASLIGEMGDVGRAIADGERDGVLTPRELQTIADEAHDVVTRATELRDAAQKRAADAKRLRSA